MARWSQAAALSEAVMLCRGFAQASRATLVIITAQDPSKNLAYIFINEGDVYNRTDGTQYSYVTVVDTNTQEVL